MKTTRRARRAADKHIGRREIDRRARAVRTRVVELDAEGRSPAVIASATGLTEETVRAVLELREPEGEGVGS